MAVKKHFTPKVPALNPIRVRPVQILIPVHTAIPADVGDLLLTITHLAAHDRQIAECLERAYNMVLFDWELSLVKPKFRSRWER